jgi:hypothetical protein
VSLAVPYWTLGNSFNHPFIICAYLRPISFPSPTLCHRDSRYPQAACKDRDCTCAPLVVRLDISRQLCICLPNTANQEHKSGRGNMSTVPRTVGQLDQAPTRSDGQGHCDSVFLTLPRTTSISLGVLFPLSSAAERDSRAPSISVVAQKDARARGDLVPCPALRYQVANIKMNDSLVHAVKLSAAWLTG